MSGFRFRLARLLDLRRTQEQEQARVAADHAREADARALVARGAAQRWAEVQRQLDQPAAGPAGLWLARGAARDTVADEAEARAAEHGAAVSRLQDALARLAEAHQDRRTTERLRDRQHATWLAATSRVEQAAMDEAGHRRSIASGENSP